MSARCAQLLTTAGLALLMTGCPEEVPPDSDRTAPRSLVSVSYPAGGTIELEPFDVFPVSTAEVSLRIDLGESGYVYYTTDGSPPAADDGSTGSARDFAVLTLRDTTLVRWYGLDQAGNREDEKRVEIVFDREPPQLRIEPPPGEYSGQVQVRVEANEAGTLYWTVDGSVPLADAPGTATAELPADIDLVLPTELRMLAVDLAGNQSMVGPLAYVIDADAPTTTADPGPGRYLNAVAVTLTTDDPEGRVYFTTDGSEPDLNSSRYASPIDIASSLTLRVRAYDAGGNAELPQSLPYAIGSRGPVGPMAGDTPEQFPMAGGLRLGAALIDASGALAGWPDAPSTGADWAAWSIGRTAIDAALIQSGVGPHGMNSPGLIDLSAAGEGVPDGNLNGSNLDDTFFARVDALAERVGADRVPDGLHPMSVLLETADASLVQPLPAARGVDGRPLWVDDYRQMRWIGTPADARTSGVDVIAAGLEAMLTRARSALAVDHPVGEGSYARRAAPVVGLRCVSCHGVSATPQITSAADLADLGLLDGPDPLLVDLLSGRAPHPVDPATPEEADAVLAWINGGAEARDDAARAPGADPREGLLGLLAIEHAAQVLAHTAAELNFDIEENRLRQFEAGREQFVIGEADILIGAAASGTSQVTQVRVLDRTFDTAAQSRLLAALAGWVRFAADRADLFEGPLAGSDAFPAVSTLARARAESLLAGLLSRVEGTDGSRVASWNPSAGAARRVEAIGLADFAIGVRAAGHALDDDAAIEAADAAVLFLRTAMKRADGDYVDGWQDGEIVPAARHLEVQWAVLEALLDAAADGDAGAHTAAELLWGRIDSMWFDARAGVWQTVFGLETWLYDPALVARTLDALGAASLAGLPDADSRLTTALDRLVIPFVWADTWLTGETRAGADVDGDGLPKPQDAGPINGVGPVFRQSMSL